MSQASPCLGTAYACAEAHLLRGELDRAERVLRAALALEGAEHLDEAGQLWELLGVTVYTQGDFEETVSALEHASLLRPLSNCGQYVLAICYEKQEKCDTAAVIYRHLSTLKNLDEDLLEPVARALGRIGDCGAALRVCKEAAQRSPESPEPLMGMAFYMQRMERSPEQILSVLFRAFHLNPEEIDCRMTLVRTLYKCGLTSEAAYLLAELSVESCRCTNCLAIMQAILQAVGDERNLSRCHAAQHAIRERRLP